MMPVSITDASVITDSWRPNSVFHRQIPVSSLEARNSPVLAPFAAMWRPTDPEHPALGLLALVAVLAGPVSGVACARVPRRWTCPGALKPADLRE